MLQYMCGSSKEWCNYRASEASCLSVIDNFNFTISHLITTKYATLILIWCETNTNPMIMLSCLPCLDKNKFLPKYGVQKLLPGEYDEEFHADCSCYRDDWQRPSLLFLCWNVFDWGNWSMPHVFTWLCWLANLRGTWIPFQV